MWAPLTPIPSFPAPNQPQMLQIHGYGGCDAGLLPGLVHLPGEIRPMPSPMASPQRLLLLSFCISWSYLESQLGSGCWAFKNSPGWWQPFWDRCWR